MNIFKKFMELIAETCLDDYAYVILLRGKPVVYPRKADADYVEKRMKEKA